MLPQTSVPSSGSPAQGNPLLASYQAWAEKTPFITRTSLIAITVIYILSFFLDADRQLGNIPYFTINHFEIYRIITSPFVGNSILTIIMIFLFYPSMGGRLESSLGSGSFASLLGSISIITNISFDIICYSLYILGMPQAIFWNSSGFFTPIFALIVIECLQVSGPDSHSNIYYNLIERFLMPLVKLCSFR